MAGITPAPTMGLFLLHLGLDKGVDLMITGGGGGILDLMGVEVNEHHRWHVTVVVIGVPLRQTKAVGIAILHEVDIHLLEDLRDGIVVSTPREGGVGREGGCCQTPFKKRADMHLLGRMGTQKQARSKLEKEIAGGF